jgi:hypothetical protein
MTFGRKVENQDDPGRAAQETGVMLGPDTLSFDIGKQRVIQD